MNTIQKLRAPRFQQPILAFCMIAVLLVLPRWGGEAMMIGASFALVICTLILDCDRLVRALLGSLALLACVTTVYLLLLR
jgi:hypothetical protein